MCAEALDCYKLEAQESKLAAWVASLSQTPHRLCNYTEGFPTGSLSLIKLRCAVFHFAL